MDTPTVSENEVERLRSDMDTIRSAMGRGLPYGRVDIRFCWFAAVTLALYGVLYHFGWRDGGIRFVALAPFLLATVAYLTYMALKSRRKSGAQPVIRNEYRLAVLVVVLLCGGLFAIRPWALRQGIGLDSIHGLVTMTLGLAICAVALMPFSHALAFRRATLVFAGAILLLMGWIIVSVDGAAQHSCIVGCGVLALVGNAALMIYFMRRENADSAEADAA